MKTLLKFLVCFVLVFLGKNSFAQTNKSLVGTWVYSGSKSIEKNYLQDADSVNFTDTIIFLEENKFSNNKSKPDDILEWEYDSTEKILLIMDMVKMDGNEYLVNILNDKELVFANNIKYTKVK